MALLGDEVRYINYPGAIFATRLASFIWSLVPASKSLQLIKKHQ